LFLRREVPIEDAFADAERSHDVGDRRGVVAPLCEKAGRALDELVSPFPTARRELASHLPSVAADLTDQSIRNWSDAVSRFVTLEKRSRHVIPRPWLRRRETVCVTCSAASDTNSERAERWPMPGPR